MALRVPAYAYQPAHAPYALPGTDVEYGAAHASLGDAHACSSTLPQVRSAIRQGAPYAIPGTDLPNAAGCPRAPCVTSGTDLPCAATGRHARAERGPDTPSELDLVSGTCSSDVAHPCRSQWLLKQQRSLPHTRRRPAGGSGWWGSGASSSRRAQAAR
eukprot:522631-Rhodomonas_salina.1